MSTPQVETSLRIIELTAENVKRLSAITIKPNGKSVRLEGSNGAGKSSVLDSIAYALGGKALIPEQPIKKGQKSGKVRVDLGELIVERRFTASGSTLAVMSKDGAKYPSPQAILDRLVGNLSFDPLAFVTMKPEEQLQTLKKVVGISFDDLESEHKGTYDERSVVNREVKQLEGQLAGLPLHEDAPEEPVSVEVLLAELHAIKQHGAQVQTILGNKQTAAEQIIRVEEQIEQCSDEIAELQKRFEAVNKRKGELKTRREELEQSFIGYQDQWEAIPILPKDEQTVMGEIQQVESTNQKVRENARRHQLDELIKRKRTEAETLTASLENIETKKEKRLAEAKFPVPGLSFSDSGVLLNGLPFEQASSAEQLRVSVGMGMAMNPRLKVLLIRDGSLLDDDNLALLSEVASQGGFQVWLEKVGKGKEVSVVIEDGDTGD